MKPLPDNYSDNMTRYLKQGDVINATLPGGTDLKKVKVQKVWADSLRVESVARTLPLRELKGIQKRKFSAGHTIALVVTPIIFMAIIGSSVRVSGPRIGI